MKIPVGNLRAALRHLDDVDIAIEVDETVNRNTLRLDPSYSLSPKLERLLGIQKWIEEIRDKYEGP